MKARRRKIGLVARGEKKLKHPKDTRQDRPLLVRYGGGRALIARWPGPNAPIYTGTGDDEVGKALARKAKGGGVMELWLWSVEDQLHASVYRPVYILCRGRHGLPIITW